MFVFLTKVKETTNDVTYKFETEVSSKPFRNTRGHTTGESKLAQGSGAFDKQTNNFHLLPGCDPYFIEPNEEVQAIEKALKKINTEKKPFPAVLELREK